jgi:hypothetical protein
MNAEDSCRRKSRNLMAAAEVIDAGRRMLVDGRDSRS